MAESRLALFQLERGNTSGLFLLTNGSNTLEFADFNESVDDRVNTLLTAGTGINLNYDDGANTLTISSTVTGTVDTSGTPANGQIAVFTDADTIEGTGDLTFDDTSTSILKVFDSTRGVQIVMDHDAAYDGTLFFEADSSLTWSFVDKASTNNMEITGSQNFAVDSNNVEVGGKVHSYGSVTAGVNVLRLNDVSQVPSGTLSSGGLLYVSGTSLYFYDDAGTATDLTAGGGIDREFDPSLGGDGTYEGDFISSTAGSGGVSTGDLCFMDTSGAWRIADADSTAQSTSLLGIALGTASASNPVDILLKGTVRMAAFPAFTPGVAYFVSTTAGDITATAPSGTGDVVRVVGHALDANTLWFNPDGAYVTVA